jgi:Glyoxalase-like domain
VVARKTPIARIAIASSEPGVRREDPPPIWQWSRTAARITISPVRIAHVIYGTSDLDAAARRVEKAVGVTAVAGGHHEGLGTHNQIVPLSDGAYIELLAVDDPDEASRSPVGAALQAAIAAGDGLLGWAVAVQDLDAVAVRLGTPISTISREGMTARLTGVAESLNEPYLPFFIERPADPQAELARRGADGITLDRGSRHARRLEQWLVEAELPVRVVNGDAAVRAVGVGERELRTR